MRMHRSSGLDGRACTPGQPPAGTPACRQPARGRPLAPRAHFTAPGAAVRLRPEPLLSPEAFRPFGQVLEGQDDGKAFDAEDAQLDLGQGTPRFYLMRLAETGLRFRRITYHAQVTQCLGGLGPRPWHLAVAAPTGSVARWPRPEDIRVFSVPPATFLKLEAGTWHAGPLFEGGPQLFYNLELSDTNVVDHNTHEYGEELVVEPL